MKKHYNKSTDWPALRAAYEAATVRTETTVTPPGLRAFAREHGVAVTSLRRRVETERWGLGGNPPTPTLRPPSPHGGNGFDDVRGMTIFDFASATCGLLLEDIRRRRAAFAVGDSSPTVDGALPLPPAPGGLAEALLRGIGASHEEHRRRGLAVFAALTYRPAAPDKGAAPACECGASNVMYHMHSAVREPDGKVMIPTTCVSCERRSSVRYVREAEKKNMKGRKKC